MLSFSALHEQPLEGYSETWELKYSGILNDIILNFCDQGMPL